MASNLFGMVRKALTKATDPNSVEEVSISSFDDWNVRRREDCLQLKGPYPCKPGTGGVKFESGNKDEVIQVANFVIIVLSSTNTKNCYSVLTTTNVQEAEKLFETYQRILPSFLAAKPELCNKRDLQRLCDSARDHPDYGLCHIAVNLDMIDLVSSSTEPGCLLHDKPPVSGQTGQDTIQTRLGHFKSLCLFKQDTYLIIIYPVSIGTVNRVNLIVL